MIVSQTERCKCGLIAKESSGKVVEERESGGGAGCTADGVRDCCPLLESAEFPTGEESVVVRGRIDLPPSSTTEPLRLPLLGFEPAPERPPRPLLLGRTPGGPLPPQSEAGLMGAPFLEATKAGRIRVWRPDPFGPGGEPEKEWGGSIVDLNQRSAGRENCKDTGGKTEETKNEKGKRRR